MNNLSHSCFSNEKKDLYERNLNSLNNNYRYLDNEISQKLDVINNEKNCISNSSNIFENCSKFYQKVGHDDFSNQETCYISITYIGKNSFEKYSEENSFLNFDNEECSQPEINNDDFNEQKSRSKMNDKIGNLDPNSASNRFEEEVYKTICFWPMDGSDRNLLSDLNENWTCYFNEESDMKYMLGKKTERDNTIVSKDDQFFNSQNFAPFPSIEEEKPSSVKKNQFFKTDK